MGPWELRPDGVPPAANGDYGTEEISVTNPGTERSIAVDSALVAGINSTDYLVGFIGVGAMGGSFGGKIGAPLISQLVESQGEIPSHSYGYTAGAYYSECILCVMGVQGETCLTGYSW